MRSRASLILLAIANLLIPVAVLIFATGFFPYKPFLPGLAKFQDLKYGDPPEAPFDKVIFMVVDALRRSGFPQQASTLFADEKVVTLSTQQIQDSRLHKGVLITLWQQLSGANKAIVSSRLAQPYHLLPMPRLPL